MKKAWQYIFPVIFGLVIYASVRLVNDTMAEEKFWERPWQLNAIELTTLVIVSYLLQWMLNYFAQKFHHPGTQNIGRTMRKEFFTVLVSTLLLVNATISPMAALTDDGLGWNDVAIINIIPTLYVLLYFAIRRSNYYLKAYVDNKLQLEKITNDQLQTELKYLKAQYHPHFLFNALNTIYFQMDENVGQAKKTIEKFSELLRYQLYDQQQTVSLEQEFTHLKNYIDLQRVRSSEKLKLDVQLEDSLANEQVYPLLLLPLVENAFKYVGGDYELVIEAKEDDEGLTFTVSNSIPPNLNVSKAGGIGLENLKRRLELLYEGKHSLVTHKEQKRFIAILKIKLDKRSKPVSLTQLTSNPA